MTRPHYTVAPTGHVHLANEVLGRVAPFHTPDAQWWLPIDCQGEPITGPTKVRSLAAMTVVRAWGIQATLLDIVEEEPCA